MTLSRPPTMRVTFGAAVLLPLPDEADELSDPPQAVRPAASAATAAVAVRMRTVFMGECSFIVDGRIGPAGSPGSGRGGTGAGVRCRRRWTSRSAARTGGGARRG